jgi:hypothetical protein
LGDVVIDVQNACSLKALLISTITQEMHWVIDLTPILQLKLRNVHAAKNCTNYPLTFKPHIVIVIILAAILRLQEYFLHFNLQVW